MAHVTRTTLLGLSVLVAVFVFFSLITTRTTTINVHPLHRFALRGEKTSSSSSSSSNSGVSGSLFQGAKQRSFQKQRLFASTDVKQHSSTVPATSSAAARKFAVCTTIFEPSEAIKQVSRMPGWSLVVVGDQGAAPFNYTAPNLVYLDVKEQQRLASTFGAIVHVLPWKHFGRKNIGYLYAISQGAGIIWDFDDDNVLKPGVQPAVPTSNVLQVQPADAHCEAFNPYPHMGGPSAADPVVPPSWPRGFPLDRIRQPCNVTKHPATTISRIAVVQTLADHDPDVDGIFRLTRGVPFNFLASSKSTLVLPPGTLTPWNAQATLFLQPAMWAMLLPVTVHGRVSDIWRSYIAQRLLWDAGYHVAFSPPMVDQFRSPHNYLADMQAEEHLYYKSGQLVKHLVAWRGKSTTLAGRFEELVIDLYERSYLELEDIKLAQAWLQALVAVGYKFPSLTSQTAADDLWAHVPTASPASGAIEPANVVKSKGDASRPLDALDLFLPITSKFVKEFQEQLLLSMQLFYPVAHLSLVMDAEKPEDKATATVLGQELKAAGVKHATHFAEPNPAVYHNNGHSRQQWVMFWADNFTTAEFVGFVDTDTVFVTRVVAENMFDGQKPRVIGLVGKPQNDWWSGVPQSTRMALEKDEVMRCMTYFPVVVRTKHLTQLRAYMEKIHKQPFDQVFERFSGGVFSQFNIMCNYLWHHHRQEYSWSLQELSPGWSGSIPGQLPSTELHQLLAADVQLTHPVARTNLHAGYLHFPSEPPHLAKAMLHGFCLSGGSTVKPLLCSKLPNITVLQKDLFVFETNDWTWDARCMDAQRLHYQNVQAAPPKLWNLTLVDKLAGLAAPVMRRARTI